MLGGLKQEPGGGASQNSEQGGMLGKLGGMLGGASAGGVLSGGLRDLVTGLPSLGDHHNNQIAAGPDGKIYFGQGVATNSGVVGVDNFVFGWLGVRS